MRPHHSLAAAVLGLLVAPALPAWHVDGHELAAAAAVRHLADRGVPPFFLAEAERIGEIAVEPDVMKLRSTPQLRAQEYPEHYLDAEDLGGRPLPDDRWAFVALARDLGLDPAKVGLLPYAITEWTQRLTLAFARHRADPGDRTVREAAVFYAGILAHYATDLGQPLHTTIHYNGRVGEDGRSPSTGIHHLVDDLFGALDFGTRPPEGVPAPSVFADVWPAVVAQLSESHGRVDRVYELEPQLAEPADHPEVRDLAAERYRVSVSFLASLYLTAWEDSADVELPSWLRGDAR